MAQTNSRREPQPVGSPGQTNSADITKVQIVESPSAFHVLRGVAGPLIKPLGALAIVIIFVIFMLLNSEDLRDRLIRLIGTDDLNPIRLTR